MTHEVEIEIPYVYRVVGVEDRGRKQRNFDLVGRIQARVPEVPSGGCIGIRFGGDEAGFDGLVHEGRLYVETETTFDAKGPMTVDGTRHEARALEAAIRAENGPSIRVGRAFYPPGTRDLALHVADPGGVRTAARRPFRDVAWSGEESAVQSALEVAADLLVSEGKVYSSRYEPVGVPDGPKWKVAVCDRTDYGSGPVGMHDRPVCRLDRLIGDQMPEIPVVTFLYPDLRHAWLVAVSSLDRSVLHRAGADRSARIRYMEPAVVPLLAAIGTAASRGEAELETCEALVAAWAPFWALVGQVAKAGVDEFHVFRSIARKADENVSWLARIAAMERASQADEDADAIAALG